MAQEDVRLSGAFLDSAGNALANKTVKLFAEGTVTSEVDTDITDSSGEWDFTVETPGRYDVQLVTGTQTYRILSRDKFQVTELQSRNPTTAQPALSAYSTTSEASSLVATFGFRPATESSGVETADTPSDNDNGYIDYTLSNDHSSKQEWIAGRFSWVGLDVSDGNEDGQIKFEAMAAGSLATVLTMDSTGVTGSIIKDEDNMASDSATHLASQQSIKAYVDAVATASDLDFQGDSGGALSIDLDSETLDIAGGNGITTTGSGNEISVAVDAAQTTITSIYATDLIIGEDAETAIDFGTANEIDFKINNTTELTLDASALYPTSDAGLDLGTSTLEFKDAFFDGTVTSDAFAGPLTGDVTGNVSGTAATVTSGTQASITTLANVTTVGALDAGSISTNFGAINNGSSAITTTGLVSAGSLTVTGTTTLNGNLILGDAAADSLTIAATIQGATPLVFEGADSGGANAHETSFAITDPTADRTITFPDATLTVNAAANISGTTLASNVVTSSLTAVGTIATGVWQGTAIASGYIAADAITGAKIADDAIDSEHYTDGSIDNDHIANGTIALAKTALVAGTNITLATNTLNVDDAFLINSGDDTTSGTITAAGFTAGDAGQVYFSDTAPASDHTATGVVISIASGESVAAFNSVYIRSDGEVGPADADAASTMPAIGVALEAKGDGEATKILVAGVLRDDTYNFTPGADLFIGTTAGEITATAPSGSGDTVQKVGVALTADSIYVNFNTTEVLLA